jgi:DNA-binding Lrp family transcriptional regulator
MVPSCSNVQRIPLLHMLESPKYTYLTEVSTAYVMVNCRDGTEKTIHDRLREAGYVSEILGTYGSYDIVVKIVAPTLGDLRDTISKIRRIKDIRSTTTLLCLSI